MNLKFKSLILKTGQAFSIALLIFGCVVWLFSDLKMIPHYFEEGDTGYQNFSGAMNLYLGKPVRYYLAGGSDYVGAGDFEGKPFLPADRWIKADHNQLFPYLLAGTWLISHRISIEPARFYISFFQTAGAVVFCLFLSLVCDMGWFFSVSLSLLLLYNPWVLKAGKLLAGDSFVVPMTVAFNCFLVFLSTSQRFLKKGSRTIRWALGALFLFSLLGVLADYYFWTSLAVAAFLLIALIIVDPLRRPLLRKFLCAITLGAVAAISLIVIDYAWFIRKNWFSYMLWEIHEHTQQPHWRTFSDGLSSIQNAFGDDFLSTAFARSIVLSIILLLISLKIEKRREDNIQKARFSKLLCLTYLLFGDVFLFVSLFSYMLPLSIDLSAIFAPLILIPFAFCVQIAQMCRHGFQFMAYGVISASLFLALLSTWGVYHPHIHSHLFSPPSDMVTSTGPKLDQKYPRFIDLIEASRFAWNMSYGFEDMRLRFPDTLDHIEMKEDIVRQVNGATLWDGESWDKLILIRILLGIDTRTHYLMKEPVGSPYDVSIIDKNALFKTFKFVLHDLDGKTSEYRILVSPDQSSPTDNQNTIQVNATEYKATLFQHLMDHSRLRWYTYTFGPEN